MKPAIDPWTERIDQLDWHDLLQNLALDGYALESQLLTEQECDELVALYNGEQTFRKTINMEQFRFGKGEYKYFDYPLPGMVQKLRENLYPYLVPVANGFAKLGGSNMVYPATLKAFLENCRKHGQLRPTPLILQYREGGYNTLHQDLYGAIHFPFQVVIFLSRPNDDYSGGEFVMVEQRPRAQSKAEVLLPGKGDVLIFTTNYRPVEGSRGYYKVAMKHGVSKIRSGQRFTLGIIFHDAK
ncbi:2OG-Fe(II) oxygenase [Fulvivirgaceae bacterium BMA10]|uniref:2OG-Fe(II) oxygenase n=1 Tax=Splendidivirga corallicola TaxID=3051826 RepID=A0ABT8KL68_9BACT|nr:2OG-Fe(II) oxygenase [Fulvivirgaceae bacterium BMA10]